EWAAHRRKQEKSLVLEKIRTSLSRQIERLLMPPFGNLAVIAGGQHGGNIMAFESLRARIMRIFEKAVFKALLVAAVERAENAGNKPDNGFEQHHGGDFASGEHIVA